jgi:hypothetical protein
MYQIIKIDLDQYLVVDKRHPHPFSGYKVVYRIIRRVSKHQEYGVIWAMEDFYLLEAVYDVIAPDIVAVHTWKPIIGKPSWEEIKKALAKLLNVEDQDLVE